MAVTRAQVNAGKAAILDALFTRYPEWRMKMLRVAVSLAKGGNATQIEVRNAILNESYNTMFSRDAVGRHDFKHWLHSALSGDDGDNVTTADSFDAQEATVL